MPRWTHRFGLRVSATRPRLGRPLTCGYETAAFVPGPNEGELLDWGARLRELASMHVEPISALVTLRDALIDQFHKLRGLATLHNIAVGSAASFGAFGAIWL